MNVLNPTRGKFYQNYAWIILFALGLLFAFSSLFIVLTGGAGMSDFEMTIGTIWSEFSASQPLVATYILRLEQLSGVAFAGFALFVTALAWTGLRQGERRSWYLMWIFPATLTAEAIVFFAADATGLGVYYGGAAVVALLGLLLPYRKFFPKDRHEPQVS